MGDFLPRPAPKLVFVFEGRPRCGERRHFHPGPKPGLQIERERLGQQRDFKPCRHRAQKGRGDDEIAQPPEFNDEQFGFQSRRGEGHSGTGPFIAEKPGGLAAGFLPDEPLAVVLEPVAAQAGILRRSAQC